MIKRKIFGWIAGLFVILTLWSVGTSEAKGYPAGAGINGVVGSGSPIGNPGNPAEHEGGSRRCKAVLRAFKRRGIVVERDS